MHANSEVGTLQPLAAIGRLACERGIPLHTDAAQSVGKLSSRVDELGVDLLIVAAHKLYALKGVGALFVRRGLHLEPLIHGAGHAGGTAGTENVVGIVGLGEACRLVGEGLEDLPRCRRSDALGSRSACICEPSQGIRCVSLPSAANA